MVKKALTLITSILIALHLLMPFNIYADSLPQADIVGVSWNLIDTEISLSSGGNWYTYTYELEVKLSNKYVGIVDGTLSYTYSYVQNTSQTPTSKTDTTTKRNYVNGDSFKFNVYISNIGQQFTGNGPMYNASYLINNSSTNVTRYEDLNSIESVVNLLTDIYTNSSNIEGLSNNQLDELEKIVSNTSLANEYLDTISKYRSYNIPIESYSASFFCFRNYDTYTFRDVQTYQYPFFDLKVGNNVFRQFLGANTEYYFIFASNNNIYNSSSFDATFEYSSNLTIVPLKTIYTFQSGINAVLVSIIPSVSDNYSLTLLKDTLIAPIYFNTKANKNMSTDFALQWGLSNKLLDDLDIIANGTTASQSAADSSQSANEQLETDSNTLFQQENGFKSDMQNAMQNVNNTFRLQDMGAKFVSSAQWVRTQYENLTNNTPFASLITFSLITGLALILLGKVYK